jgi:thiosulfate reductase/polysulfide reductase chain A
VEEITWVPSAQIRAAARLFAETRPAALEWGAALEHTPNCLQTIRALALIPAVTGKIDVPGGWIFGMHLLEDTPLLLEALSQEMKDKRLGADQFKVLSSKHAFFPSAHAPTIFEAMRTGKPYPIKAFLIFGNNGLLTYANSRRVYESLSCVDFLTVMDLYMTPTAELADIVLPSATWLEADEIVVMPIIAANVALAQQKVVRTHECKQPEEVFVELAKRLNLTVGKEPLNQILDSQLEHLGINFEELKQKGFLTVPITYRKYENTGFRTESGKIELASNYLEMLGYDPLPYYEEPPESPVSTPQIAEKYPFILITGARSPYFFNSEYRQISSLRKRHRDPIVEIHPDSARKLGIVDGDWVWIESPRGRIQQKARLTDGIDPRVVHVEQAWWFPEDPAPEYGVWKSNANVLTSGAPPYDPAMGTYQLRALLCNIYKE